MVENRGSPKWPLWGALILLIALSCSGGAALSWITWTNGIAPFLAQARQPTPTATQTTVAETPTAVALEQTSNELEEQIEQVYAKISPSVVNITNRSTAYDFFLNAVPQEGTGSGFFYDNQGHIVTNYHVVEGAQELQVTLADERNLPATLIGADPANDLAVIKVDLPSTEVPVAPLGDSTKLRIGQFMVAIGNPFGLERTLTVGVVSSLGRVIESPNDQFIGEAIQTDASINPGNSGGPLLNLRGEIVGVNSAILSPSGTSAGIGFAIPARTVERVVPALIKNGQYLHPTLGVNVFELTPQRIRLLERAGMTIGAQNGLLIAQIDPNGPAAHAGLQAGQRSVRIGNVIVPTGGDIITAIDGTPMPSVRDFSVYLETRTSVGQIVEVTVIRDGQQHTVSVKVGETQPQVQGSQSPE